MDAVHFSTGKDDWATPDEVFEPLNAEFGFDIDVAADARNRKVPDWFGLDSVDALAVDWADYYVRTAWCNPPYSRGLQGKFIAKAAEAAERGITTVMLLPARTDTKAFHEFIWDREKHQPREGVEVRFLKGRVRFKGAPASAPFPSMVVVFRPSSGGRR